MNNGSLSLENDNNVICEAVGCRVKACNKVGVKVGSKQTIFLFLCDNCKPKFCSPSDDYKESKTAVTSN